ncbi:MAG: 1,4-dihydroxy-2-naphthoate octaprenyltransferase [Desulfobacterales bacterium]
MNRVYRDWLLASRPWSFSMTAISVSVGSALAAMNGPFSWPLYGLALIGAVLMHAASNLINDYDDVRSGVDDPQVPTARYRPHPLMEKRLTLSQVRNTAYALYALAAAIGIFLTFACGPLVFWLGLVGTAAGITYTAPPLSYKYSALGEFSVFLMWGPLMVTGAYYVQRRAVSAEALLISIPFGVLVALVLLANNIRDINYDRTKGIQTLPIVLGARRGISLYLALIVAAYAAVAAMSVFGPLKPWSLIVLLSAPLAAKLLRQMAHNIPLDADAQTAKLDTAFGLLLVISLLAGIRI